MEAHYSQGSLTFPEITKWECKNKRKPELVIGHRNNSANDMQLCLLLPLLATMKGHLPLGEMDISELYTGNLLKVPYQSKRQV